MGYPCLLSSNGPELFSRLQLSKIVCLLSSSSLSTHTSLTPKMRWKPLVCSPCNFPCSLEHEQMGKRLLPSTCVHIQYICMCAAKHRVGSLISHALPSTFPRLTQFLFGDEPFMSSLNVATAFHEDRLAQIQLEHHLSPPHIPLPSPPVPSQASVRRT